MSLSEREAATGLITTLIVVAMFWLRLSDQHETGHFGGPDALQVWARSVLLLVAVSIGIAIAVTVLFHIAHVLLAGAPEPGDRRDERDVQIERRAMQIGMHLLSFGLLGVIVDLALGASAFRAMNLILALCAASEIVKDGYKLYRYRTGA